MANVEPRATEDAGAEVLTFGRLEIRPALRQVSVDGAPVPLGARAFDLLMWLVAHRDRVVGREELLERVWPHLVVEENNLSVQISALRRMLGSDVITTVTGRGYRFTPPLARSPGPVPSVATRRSGNLPAREVALIGRDEDLAQLLHDCEETACVTVCGPAGIGKTVLATQAAQRIAASRALAQGAWRVELSDVVEPARVVHAVCDALGIELEGRDEPLRECLDKLRHRQLLLLLDNCEHVIDAAAAFVDAVLQSAAAVRVLATSQEPLRVDGERVLRLTPLAVPASAQTEDAAAYGAVSLLLQRVRDAMGSRFEPSAVELDDLVQICRQLDGIPLALEFAATRVPLLGTAGVRSRLRDRLRLLSGGLRGAPARHRSLQAALEWSHQLLSPRTQAVLHRLAVFPGGFSLLGARLLLGADDEADVIEPLEVLVDRSLVACRPGLPRRYRMPETTRAFALECLREGADGIDWDERMALAMARLCALSAGDRDATLMWQEMPNARAALAWALAAPGHGQTAVTIATYISVVLATGGAIREGLESLQRVRAHVGDDCPAPLAARYWQRLGRLGVEGRLPTSLCVDALERADRLFTALDEPRHRHACQRHLAEAELRGGDVEQAEVHLRTARALEQAQPSPSPADRMRRLRVEALLADARNQPAEALRHAQAALTLAEALSVDRYRLLLTADMGWIHLQMGHADAAVTSFQELLAHLDGSPRLDLARAHAMAGLTAALVADGRIDEALRSAGRAVPTLQQVNLLRSRCDVFAWVAAAAGDAPTAALLVGVADAFADRTETRRDPVAALAWRCANALVAAALREDERAHWQRQGAEVGDDELLHRALQAFRPRAGADGRAVAADGDPGADGEAGADRAEPGLPDDGAGGPAH